jgi:hypothetical protein
MAVDGCPVLGMAVDGCPVLGMAVDGCPVLGMAVDGCPVLGMAVDGAAVVGHRAASSPEMKSSQELKLDVRHVLSVRHQPHVVTGTHWKHEEQPPQFRKPHPVAIHGSSKLTIGTREAKHRTLHRPQAFIRPKNIGVDRGKINISSFMTRSVPKRGWGGWPYRSAGPPPWPLCCTIIEIRKGRLLPSCPPLYKTRIKRNAFFFLPSRVVSLYYRVISKGRWVVLLLGEIRKPYQRALSTCRHRRLHTARVRR